MWRTVGIPFERDRGHGDDRTRLQPRLELVVLRLTVGEGEPPTVVVHHQADVIRVVERPRRAIERRSVEAPLRRCCSPDEFREVISILVVTRTTSLGRE